MIRLTDRRLGKKATSELTTHNPLIEKWAVARCARDPARTRERPRPGPCDSAACIERHHGVGRAVPDPDVDPVISDCDLTAVKTAFGWFYDNEPAHASIIPT